MAENTEYRYMVTFLSPVARVDAKAMVVRSEINFTSVIIQRNHPLRNEQDIENLQEFLRGEREDPNLKVIAFSRLEDE